MVLVVDDEPAIRNLATRALTRAGYVVLTAAGGGEALRLVQEHHGPIDLLLSDHVMPGMSGPEVIARARELRPDLRVALMSGYPSKPAHLPSPSEGGVPLLPKPFTLDVLGAFVADQLAPEASRALEGP